METSFGDVKNLLEYGDRGAAIQVDDPISYEPLREVLSAFREEDTVYAVLMNLSPDYLEENAGTDDAYAIVPDRVHDEEGRGWIDDRKAFVASPANLTDIGAYTLEKIDETGEDPAGERYLIVDNTVTLEMFNPRSDLFLDRLRKRATERGVKTYVINFPGARDERKNNRLLNLVNESISYDQEEDFYRVRHR